MVNVSNTILSSIETTIVEAICPTHTMLDQPYPMMNFGDVLALYYTMRVIIGVNIVRPMVIEKTYLTAESLFYDTHPISCVVNPE